MSLFRSVLPAFRSAVVRAPTSRVVVSRSAVRSVAVRGFAVQGQTARTAHSRGEGDRGARCLHKEAQSAWVGHSEARSIAAPTRALTVVRRAAACRCWLCCCVSWRDSLHEGSRVGESHQGRRGADWNHGLCAGLHATHDTHAQRCRANARTTQKGQARMQARWQAESDRNPRAESTHAGQQDGAFLSGASPVHIDDPALPVAHSLCPRPIALLWLLRSRHLATLCSLIFLRLAPSSRRAMRSDRWSRSRPRRPSMRPSPCRSAHDEQQKLMHSDARKRRRWGSPTAASGGGMLSTLPLPPFASPNLRLRLSPAPHSLLCVSSSAAVASVGLRSERSREERQLSCELFGRQGWLDDSSEAQQARGARLAARPSQI